jgi:DNA-binding MarR family transcriptional regulator
VSQDERIERVEQLSRALVQTLHIRGIRCWDQLELTTIPQLRTLFVLTDGGPMSIGGVAARLGVRLPAASSLVDRLVDHGLAHRREDVSDRRRTLAYASEEGRSLVERLRQGSRETLRAWLEKLAPADLEALVRGLEAVVRVSTADEDAAKVAHATSVALEDCR